MQCVTRPINLNKTKSKTFRRNTTLRGLNLRHLGSLSNWAPGCLGCLLPFTHPEHVRVLPHNLHDIHDVHVMINVMSAWYMSYRLFLLAQNTMESKIVVFFSFKTQEIIFLAWKRTANHPRPLINRTLLGQKKSLDLLILSRSTREFLLSSGSVGTRQRILLNLRSSEAAGLVRANWNSSSPVNKRCQCEWCKSERRAGLRDNNRLSWNITSYLFLSLLWQISLLKLLWQDDFYHETMQHFYNFWIHLAPLGKFQQLLSCHRATMSSCHPVIL